MTAIGIDLGTTYSCVAVYKDGRVEIIANDIGARTTPSYVAITPDGEKLVGEPAKAQISKNPLSTVYDAKRLIGRLYTDKTVQTDIKQWSFKVTQNDHNKPVIHLGNTPMVPEEISAMILTKMKETAEAYLGHQVANAVITVPAYFNDAQRRATVDAGRIAGLNILKIINEPTAAAMAYGLDKQGDRTVLIYDFGGGTLDCSILNIADGVFQVIATSGNNHLGGEDLDNRLVLWVLKEFSSKNPRIDIQSLMTSSRTLSRIRTACEQAKRNLSLLQTASIEIDALWDGIDYRTQLTRAKFEDLCRDEFKKCIDPLKQVLDDSGLTKESINDIVLVGGSTRIPKIRELLRDYFNKEPHTDINPDEAVAYGAAVQAAVLSGVNDKLINTLVLIDVAPLSLGIETAGGIMTNLIPRNKSIPCTVERTFSTFSDNQTVVTIKVYEGERSFTKHNNLLGTFDLTGITPMLRGVPQITVKFRLDNNSILSVSAKEELSGKTSHIIIKNDQNRYSDEELSLMIEKAEKYNKIDNHERKKIEIRHLYETYIYGLRTTIQDEEIRTQLGDEKCKELADIINKGMYWLEDIKNQQDSTYVVDYKDKQQEIEKLVTPILLSAQNMCHNTIAPLNK